MRGKKPLSETEVKSLRKLLEDKPLHSLLLNIGVDTMLRGSDLREPLITRFQSISCRNQISINFCLVLR